MVQGHQDCHLHFSSSHHERTYPLSRQEHQDCKLHSSSSHHERTYTLTMQEHQDCHFHSISSHHDRTYPLSRQEWCKDIKTISFIPAPATMTELTSYQCKNCARASR